MPPAELTSVGPPLYGGGELAIGQRSAARIDVHGQALPKSLDRRPVPQAFARRRGSPAPGRGSEDTGLEPATVGKGTPAPMRLRGRDDDAGVGFP